MILCDRRLAVLELLLGWSPSTMDGSRGAFSADPPLPGHHSTRAAEAAAAEDGPGVSSFLAVKGAADLICTFTPAAFRTAVLRSGGRFLYRGAERTTTTLATPTLPPTAAGVPSGWIHAPEPDLLLPGTYGDDDSGAALEYFECLEGRLLLLPMSTAAPDGAMRTTTEPTTSTATAAAIRITARPSNGHIGTSDPEEAALWGADAVVSVWPLGDELSYVWPQDRATFFPFSSSKFNDVDDDPHRSSAAVGKNESCTDDDRLVVDVDLEKALTLQREVLFASRFRDGSVPVSGLHDDDALLHRTSAFLAIPIEFDTRLRRQLEKRSYGL